MKKRRVIEFEERLLIEKKIKEKFTSFRDLARRIDRDKSTLHYEFRRTGFLSDPKEYNALEAQKISDDKRASQSLRMRGLKTEKNNLIEDPVLREDIVTRIESLEFQIDILVSQLKKIEGQLNGKNEEL